MISPRTKAAYNTPQLFQQVRQALVLVVDPDDDRQFNRRARLLWERYARQGRYAAYVVQVRVAVLIYRQGRVPNVVGSRARFLKPAPEILEYSFSVSDISSGCDASSSPQPFTGSEYPARIFCRSGVAAQTTDPSDADVGAIPARH
jgi:hypothetical protein